MTVTDFGSVLAHNPHPKLFAHAKFVASVASTQLHPAPRWAAPADCKQPTYGVSSAATRLVAYANSPLVPVAVDAFIVSKWLPDGQLVLAAVHEAAVVDDTRTHES